MSIVSEYDIEQLKIIVRESFSFAEVGRKIGYKSNSCKSIIESFLKDNNISTEHFTHMSKDYEVRTEDNIFIQNSTANQKTLRKWYFKNNYSNYCCAICGQEPFWQGKELSLTLDHINGVNNDNRLENLRWVCPNCDRQLETFGSKNIVYQKQKNDKLQFVCIDCGKPVQTKTSKRCMKCAKINARLQERPTENELLELLKTHNGNFCAIGKMFNVSDNAIRKWCRSYGLPTTSKSYK